MIRNLSNILENVLVVRLWIKDVDFVIEMVELSCN